jgi:hypothetical protein
VSITRIVPMTRVKELKKSTADFVRGLQ